MTTEENSNESNPSDENDKKKQSLKSAFYHAVDAGNMDVVNDLVEAGVALDSCFEALERAAEKGNIEMLAFLLSKIDSLWQWQIRNMICHAAQNDHMDAVRVIIDWADPVQKTATAAPPQPQKPQGPAA